MTILGFTHQRGAVAQDIPFIGWRIIRVVMAIPATVNNTTDHITTRGRSAGPRSAFRMVFFQRIWRMVLTDRARG